MEPENMATPPLSLVERESRFYDVQVAIKHGPVAAIVYSRIRYWVAKNLAEGRNVDEYGVAWTYDSAQQMADNLAFASLQQVQRALQDLKKDGLIVSKPDPNSWTRRLWYSLPDSEWHQICFIDASNLTHRHINPDTSRHIKSDTSTYTERYVNKDTRKEHKERPREDINTHLASLGDAPTSSSLSVGFGVSSIGNGEAEPECSPRPIRRDSKGGQPPCDIKTPPLPPPPLKTRKKGHPVDPLDERIERAPMVFTSEKEHAQLLTTRSPELLAKAYEEVSDWKVSIYETDPKKANAHTDFYRVKGWGTRTAQERLQPSRGSSNVPRKGHIHADEIAKQDMKHTTPQQVNTGTTLIRKFKYTLETCLEIYRKGGLKLEEIREVFPEYTGDGT